MSLMEVRELQSLVAIVDAGSFSIAAERLYVTQSALSHQIKRLEAECGSVLLVRRPPPVVATAEGERVVEAARRLLAELEKLKRSFDAPTGELTGRLSVACDGVGFTYIYGDVCEAFMKAHPAVELFMHCVESPREAIQQLRKGIIDMVFGPLHLATGTPEVGAVPVWAFSCAVIVSPFHSLAGVQSATVDQLREHLFVAYEDDMGPRLVTDRVFLSGGGYPQLLAKSNSTEFIKRIVMMGRTVAIVPEPTIRGELAAGRLACLTLEAADLSMGTGIMTRPGPRSRLTTEFISFCRRMVSSAGLSPLPVPAIAASQ
jgi:DNA-binding transcriptional LysR family regulator